jgi:hypothetical protein
VNAGNYNIDSATGALAGVYEAVERRSIVVDAALADLNKTRKVYLKKKAAELLPAINNRVLKFLDHGFPSFVTSPIRQSFESNKKFLGLFAGSRYQQTLDYLQTHFASHLDVIKFRDLRDMDEEITELLAEKRSLNTKREQASELLKLMRRAKAEGIKLPETVAEQIRRIDRHARSGRVPVGQQYKSSHTYSSRSYTNTPTPQDDQTDLLFYILTDIPTSFRTAMIEVFEDSQRTQNIGQGGTFGGAGASGDWSDNRQSAPDSSTFDAPSFDAPSSGFGSAIVSGGVAVAAGVAAVEVAGIASDFIATDDSLGPFS